jgi:hypothetical protein
LLFQPLVVFVPQAAFLLVDCFIQSTGYSAYLTSGEHTIKMILDASARDFKLFKTHIGCRTTFRLYVSQHLAASLSVSVVSSIGNHNKYSTVSFIQTVFGKHDFGRVFHRFILPVEILDTVSERYYGS